MLKIHSLAFVAQLLSPTPPPRSSVGAAESDKKLHVTKPYFRIALNSCFLILGVALSGAAFAKTCDSGHWIKQVLNLGKVIELEDGRLLRITDIDSITSSIWLPTSNVTICEDRLINLDDGETVLLANSSPNGALPQPHAFPSPNNVERRAPRTGGLSPQEMDAARKAVDPEGKLTDSQRNMAALGSVYQYWANKGDGDKASRVAFQMLQHYRAALERYAAMAAHANESGELGFAAKAMLKAYANVPDGRDMALTQNPDDPSKLVYSFTDEKGKTVLMGIVTTQQLASSAMGLALSGFDKAILKAAGIFDPQNRSQERRDTP